jgi:hypothetical protein
VHSSQAELEMTSNKKYLLSYTTMSLEIWKIGKLETWD